MMNTSTATPNQIELIEHDTFLVAGVSTRTNNANEANPHTAQIPLLWTLFNVDAVANDIINQTSNSPIYGVYHRYAADMNGDYSVTAGVGVTNVAVTVEEEGIETIAIAAGRYAVFRVQGADRTQTVIDTWAHVWAYFAAHPELRRAYQTDFEAYLGKNSDGLKIVEIHIGVV